MTFEAQYANADNSAVTRSDLPNSLIPVDLGNRQYAEILAAGVTIAPYVPPPVPVPQFVTARQGRLQLLADGLMATVEAMVAAPGADAALKIEWEYSTIWERDSAWIGQLAAALGLTDAELDRMFTEAAAR